MELHGVIVVEDQTDAIGRDVAAALPAAARIANRPIADHVLESLSGTGVRRVVVASSERTADRVRACLRDAPSAAGLEFTYVHRRAPVGLVSALSMAAPIIDGSPCIVHAAGGLLAEPLRPLTAAVGRADAVLVVHRARRGDPRPGHAVPESLALAGAGAVDAGLAVTGVCALGAGALAQAMGLVDDSELELGALTGRIAAAGGRVDVRLTEGWRAYHGDAADLLELNRVALDRLAPDCGVAPPGPATGATRIEGRVGVGVGATVTRSLIVGPTVIGPGACISDAYVGPYTSVGEGARIEGAEIERSIVEPGASIVHVGHRLSASIIGSGARVFRDFEVPRSMRLRVGEGAEVGLC